MKCMKGNKTMKQNIHPKAQLVIFEDSQTKEQFLIESTAYAKEKGIYLKDGKEYPIIKVDVTSDSHPFYTGAQTFVQVAGRIDKFNRRAAKRAEVKEIVEETVEEVSEELAS